jgi:phosphatidylglycerophosphate synthase
MKKNFPAPARNPPRFALDAAVLLIQDREALSRVARPLLRLSTLRRTSLCLREAGAAKVLICVPDAQCLREASLQKASEGVAEIVVGSAGVFHALESIGMPYKNKVLLMDADTVVVPNVLKAIVETPASSEIVVFGQPISVARLPLWKALRFFQEGSTPGELIASLREIKGVPVGKHTPASFARLDAENGSQRAVHILFEAARRSTDSFLGGINRSLSFPMTRFFISMRLTPNAVTFLALITSILGGWAFIKGDYFGFLLGAALVFLSSLLDASDGEMARLTYRESAFGCWLDSACDYLSYFFVFGGIFWGAARSDQLPGLWSVVSILSGLVISIGIFVWYRYRLSRRSGQPHRMNAELVSAMEKRAGDPLVRLAQVLAKLPTRGDLAYIILAFALVGQWKAFLIFISVSVHMVWTLAFYIGWKAKELGLWAGKPEPPPSPDKASLATPLLPP